MFGDLLAKWTRGSEKDGGKPQFRSAGDVQELLREDLAVVFKHSTACPVSWAAHAQVMKFMRACPEAPVYLVPVIKERPFSQRIAAETGVRHESPQVIVLRKGAVVATASHGDITADELGEMVGEKSRD
jgi:bacillithiol system protein YtxJ